jgi:hypothetical protein
VADTATIARKLDASEGDELPPNPERTRRRLPAEPSRRRFTIAVFGGTAIVLPALLWVMWDLWSGSLNPLRSVPYDYFYDLQARTMFHGHLYLPNGKMGIEAFVHNGHDYTYFGIFPSLIRMPILLVTSRLDGQMTAPSILVAWMLTALFSSLMLWRIRILMRGEALVGRAEAASYGVLMATIMGGSVVLYLAATPFVYSEDFAWSVPLTVGSLFALLGVLERPSRGRVVASGLLILCANLDRTPPGWALSITAFLVAGWFALGRGGASSRRWALPLLAVGIVPFLVSSAVTYIKFGIPVGLPMADQVWATVNAHRRYFLAANGGKAFSFGFLPSTLWAYLQPFGVRIGDLFPFITPPAAPAGWLNGAVLDQTYPTASFPATTPLLFLLGCWGAVTAFRPKGLGQVRLTRIILLGAAAGAGGVLLWGYISQRYLADLMPFFIIAGGIGLIDLWRRLATRPRRDRSFALGGIIVFAVYCLAANVAIAAFPVAQWTMTQSARYLSVQNSLSIGSLADSVQRGSALPDWAPAGQVFAINNCSGLYLSTGNDMKDVPGQQIEHYTWMPVEQPSAFTHTIGFTFNRPVRYLTHPLPLMTYGKSTLVMEPAGPGYARMQIDNSGTSISWPSPSGWRFPVTTSLLHEQLQISVTTDPNLKSIIVEWYGSEIMINHFVAGKGPAVVKTTAISPGSVLPVVTVADVPTHTTTNMNLCLSLLRGR